jgi:integrase
MRYYLKPRSGIWYICWTGADGSPNRKTAGTRDRGEAELALARHQLEHSRPRDQALTTVTIEGVLVRYWQHHGQTRFSPEVIRRVIALATEHLALVTLDQLTIGRQEQFIRDAGLKPGTARRYLGVIRAALEWSAARQEIERAPRILRVEVEDGPGAAPYAINEQSALLGAAQHEHERRFLLLAIATGARPEALLQLTWDRVKDGVVDFNVPGRRRTKKRRARAPLTGTVAKWLEDQRGLGPVVQWRDKQLKDHKMTFKRLAERGGVVGTAYGLRKALATWLRQRNVPEWEVGGILGHKATSATTERYAHHRPDYMQATNAAVEALLLEICPGWLASYLPGSAALYIGATA